MMPGPPPRHPSNRLDPCKSPRPFGMQLHAASVSMVATESVGRGSRRSLAAALSERSSLDSSPHASIAARMPYFANTRDADVAEGFGRAVCEDHPGASSAASSSARTSTSVAGPACDTRACFGPRPAPRGMLRAACSTLVTIRRSCFSGRFGRPAAWSRSRCRRPDPRGSQAQERRRKNAAHENRSWAGNTIPICTPDRHATHCRSLMAKKLEEQPTAAPRASVPALSRRQALFAGAAVAGGAAALASGSAKAAPSRGHVWERTYSGGPQRAADAPGQPGVDYQPTFTPGGSTLPFAMLGP